MGREQTEIETLSEKETDALGHEALLRGLVVEEESDALCDAVMSPQYTAMKLRKSGNQTPPGVWTE